MKNQTHSTAVNEGTVVAFCLSHNHILKGDRARLICSCSHNLFKNVPTACFLSDQQVFGGLPKAFVL